MCHRLSKSWYHTIRWTVKPTVNLQIGTDFNENKNYSSAEGNYLGVFTFSSLADYLAGHPIIFTQTTGDPVVNVSQLAFASFIQADWRVNPKLNVGAGLRYQAQQNLHDHTNLGPTFQIAYQPRNGTVLRAGGRVSYQVFNIGNVETYKRQDGSGHQVETVILNPSYPNPYLNLDAGPTGTTNASIRTLDPKLAAPYIINSALTWEQNLKKGWRISTSADVTRDQTVPAHVAIRTQWRHRESCRINPLSQWATGSVFVDIRQYLIGPLKIRAA